MKLAALMFMFPLCALLPLPAQALVTTNPDGSPRRQSQNVIDLRLSEGDSSYREALVYFSNAIPVVHMMAEDTDQIFSHCAPGNQLLPLVKSASKKLQDKDRVVHHLPSDNDLTPSKKRLEQAVSLTDACGGAAVQEMRAELRAVEGRIQQAITKAQALYREPYVSLDRAANTAEKGKFHGCSRVIKEAGSASRIRTFKLTAASRPQHAAKSMKRKSEDVEYQAHIHEYLVIFPQEYRKLIRALNGKLEGTKNIRRTLDKVHPPGRCGGV